MERVSVATTDYEQKVHWLLRFAHLDLQTMQPAEMMDLQHDVLKFPSGSSAAVWRAESAELTVDKRTVEFGARPYVVLRLQESLREGLNRLRKGRAWELPFVPSRRRIAFRDGVLTSRYFGGSRRGVREVFLAAAADLLIAFWPRIRECKNEKCSSLFLKEGKQLYCSDRCRQRANWEKFLERHPTRKRDYTGEYIRRRKLSVGAANAFRNRKLKKQKGGN